MIKSVICKYFSCFGQVTKWAFSISEAHPHNRLICDQSRQNYLMEYEDWIRDSNNGPFKVHGVKRQSILYDLPYFKAHNKLFQCDNQFAFQWRGLCHVSSNVNPI